MPIDHYVLYRNSLVILYWNGQAFIETDVAKAEHLTYGQMQQILKTIPLEERRLYNFYKV